MPRLSYLVLRTVQTNKNLPVKKLHKFENVKCSHSDFVPHYLHSFAVLYSQITYHFGLMFVYYMIISSKDMKCFWPCKK